MKLTPDIIQREFIGLNAKVAQNTNPTLKNAKGKVIDETRNTFTIHDGNKERVVVKDSSSFHFTLNDGTVVEIDGKLLIGRPEDRVKKHVRRLW